MTVVQLARVAEQILFITARWQAWHHVLSQGLTASKAAHASTIEAYFSHQLGSLELCLDHLDEASRLLRHALTLREQDGDTDGADLTRHNLQLVEPPAAEPLPRAGGRAGAAGPWPPCPVRWRWPSARSRSRPRCGAGMTTRFCRPAPPRARPPARPQSPSSGASPGQSTTGGAGSETQARARPRARAPARAGFRPRIGHRNDPGQPGDRAGRGRADRERGRGRAAERRSGGEPLRHHHVRLDAGRRRGAARIPAAARRPSPAPPSPSRCAARPRRPSRCPTWSGAPWPARRRP